MRGFKHNVEWLDFVRAGLCGSSKATCSMETALLWGYIVGWLDIECTKTDTILCTQIIWVYSHFTYIYCCTYPSVRQNTHPPRENVFIEI
jgi:hypothetical protein